MALLVALIFTVTSCSGGSPAPEFEGPYRHVLLISLDTTRADQIGCFGGKIAKTPRIDSLAEGGVLFEQTTSAASSTLASHTSIMTGLYPRRHGVARNGFMVNRENVMLAEVLGQNGFHTAGVIGSFALDEIFDFDQGFDFWDQDFNIEFDMRNADQNQRRGDYVTDAALSHVDQLDSSERLFLFVHYFDVHSPYSPPEPFVTQYALPNGPRTSDFDSIDQLISNHQERLTGRKRGVYGVGLSRPLVKLADGAKIPGDEGLAALYNGELAFTDMQVGRLLDGLDERGYLEDCIIILTADHGETFWEHADFWHHGVAVYQTNVHVPFIVKLPDGRGRGTHVARPVSGVDIFPTLLDLLEIPLPESVAGISLVQALDGAAPPSRPLFTEATQPTGIPEDRGKWENQLKAQGVRMGRWKYIQTPYFRYEELFDLVNDPGEQVNLLQNPPGAPVDQMAELKDPAPGMLKTLRGLRAELDGARRRTDPRDSHFNSTQMANVLKRLQDLGYVGEDGQPIPDHH